MVTLSQDIIFYWLTHHFDASFLHRSHRSVETRPPRCFSETEQDLGCLIVAEAAQYDALSAWLRDHAAVAHDTTVLIIGNVAPIKLPPAAGVSQISVSADHALGQVMNTVMEMYQIFETWQSELEIAISDPHAFKRIVDSCDSVLDGPFCIMNDEFEYVAYSDSSRSIGVLESAEGEEDAGVPAAVLQEFTSLPDFREASERHDTFLQSFSFGDGVSKNLFCNGSYVGRMSTRISSGEDVRFRYWAAIFDKLAPYVERAYAKRRSFAHGPEPLADTRQWLTSCLEGNPITAHEWEAAATLLGWAYGDSLQIVQLLPNLRYDDNLYSKRTIPIIEERWGGCIGLEYHGKLLVLVNLDCFTSNTGSGFDQALSYFIRDNLMTAGLSNSFSEINNIRAAYIQTEVALATSATDSSLKWTFHFKDCVVPFMLQSCTGEFSKDAQALASDKLLALKQNDAEKGTNYFETLRTFLECRFNASETARRLFIHRSSFLSRMDRIQALVDVQLDDPDELLYLLISYRLLSTD